MIFLAGLSRPAAVWCENDFIARMVCNAAEYLGIAVPHQLAVVGCGDYRVAVHGSPSITTLPRPAEEIGFAASRLLLQWIEDGELPSDIDVAPGHCCYGSLVLTQLIGTKSEWPERSFSQNR